MNARRRQKIIEHLNNAFMDVVEEREGSKIAGYVKQINREIIDNAETITRGRIEELIEQTPLSIGNSTDMFMVLSSITLLLKEHRLDRKKRKALKGIIAVSALYNLNKVSGYKSAATFAKNVHNSVSAPKGPKNKAGAAYIDAFKTDNSKMYNQVKKTTERNIRNAQKVSKLSMSKQVLDEYHERVAKGQPRESIRYHLQRKYNADHAVARAVETESHNQMETAKLQQGKDLGYTHKTWYTQSDHKVRNTAFHKQIHRTRVEIDEEFRVAGQTANNPGDMRLKPKDRINCRCYTILS